MNYIVIDLEFNQSFDFEKNEKSPPDPKCPFEVIQIGAVKLDEKLNTTEYKRFDIKPSIYTRVHPYVEKITGLTDEALASSDDFTKVYGEFLTFASGEENVFCSWGNSDVKMLYKNILYYNLNHENLSKKYFDVQKQMAKMMNLSHGHSIGLKNAAELLSLPIELSFHDALNDALYTADIFKVVHNNEIKIENLCLNTGLQTDKSVKSLDIDVKKLFNDAQNVLEKKLSKAEKRMVLKVYSWGRTKKFDTTKE